LTEALTTLLAALCNVPAAVQALENRTLDSKIEMDILDALDEIRAVNTRHERVDTAAILAKRSAAEAAADLDAALPGGAAASADADELLVQSIQFKQSGAAARVQHRLSDSDGSGDELQQQQLGSSSSKGKAPAAAAAAGAAAGGADIVARQLLLLLLAVRALLLLLHRSLWSRRSARRKGGLRKRRRPLRSIKRAKSLLKIQQQIWAVCLEDTAVIHQID
jgi:Saf4/Yju2 protein